jgi:hypothetical protein
MKNELGGRHGMGVGNSFVCREKGQAEENSPLPVLFVINSFKSSFKSIFTHIILYYHIKFSKIKADIF